MVTTANILSGNQNSQLFAIQQTSASLESAQTRLSTGNRVNSATDNPQNFFQSFSLSSRASNLSRVLDSLGQSVATIQSAEVARGTLENIVSQAQSQTQNAIETLRSNQQDLGSVILADNPVLFYRLNETSGTVANNLGTGGAALNGTYAGGVELDAGALTFSLDNSSVEFNGTNGRVNIGNNTLINTDPAGYPQRSVELTFQANNLDGRQVLFEEGGTGNSAAIYLDDDRIYFVARDAGDFGPFNISAEVEANQTYQAAFVLDSDNGTFTGYLNGQVVGEGAVNRPLSRHGGAVAIGRNAGGTFFHDGAEAGNGEYFDGKISDFALYNSALTQQDLQNRFDVTQFEQAEFFQNEVNNILSQIDSVVEDSGFKGINLLNNDNLRTDFTLNGDSNLITQGTDLSFSALGIESAEFNSFADIDKTLSSFIDANQTIRDFGNGLSNDLNLIEARQDFTSNTINNLSNGSRDLIEADTQEAAADVLALQTRQQVQTSTLSLSTQGSNIADLLSRNPLLNA